MPDSADKAQGLLASSKRLVKTLLLVAQNRLELFVVELQEERWRVFEALLLAAAVAVFGLMTLIAVTFLVVAFFWQERRFAVLLACGGLYLVGALGAYWRLRRRLKNWPAFSATLAEIKKDQAWWDQRN